MLKQVLAILAITTAALVAATETKKEGTEVKTAEVTAEKTAPVADAAAEKTAPVADAAAEKTAPVAADKK